MTFDQALLRQPAGTRAKAVLHKLLHPGFPNHGRRLNTLLNTCLAKMIAAETEGE